MKIQTSRNAGLTVLSLMVLLSPCGRSEALYGLSQNTLLTFDSANPGTLGAVRPITGLQGDSLIGIDVRPATGALYGLGSSLRLFTIEPSTGAATLVSATPFAAPGGATYGLDFNQSGDAARVINSDAQNLRINPGGALIATDSALAYAVGDPNFGHDPHVVTLAYANDNPGTTKVRGIDTSTDAIVEMPSPNSGVLSTKGLLGVNTTDKTAFDISGVTGTAYASLTKPGDTFSGLYRVDLNSGAATLVGNIGFASPLVGLTVSSVPEPGTYALLAMGIGAFLAFRYKRGSIKIRG